MPADKAGSAASVAANVWEDVEGWEADNEGQGLLESQGPPEAAAGAGKEQGDEIANGQAAGPVPRVVGAAAGEPVAPLGPQTPSTLLRQLYEVWPSRNSFFCRGFCMTGGTNECCAPNICIWSFIMVPCSAYFYFVFPSLLRSGAYPLALATLGVFLVTTSLLVLTSCTDPGIVPRRQVILATKSQDSLKETLGYDVMGVVLDAGELGVPKNLWQQGYRWCRTCKIVRPPRSSHCPDCDNCVLRFDHHCPFVNNCIGQRNYCFFFGFLSSVMVLGFMVIPSLLMAFAAADMEDSMKDLVRLSSYMSLTFIAIAVFFGSVVVVLLMSLGLWAYHVFLISTNRTTKEQQKKMNNVAQDPMLCTARGPQLFDPWALVDPRDLHASRGVAAETEMV